MYRLSVLYGVPTDPRAFDEYYRKVHIPIARRMRGLTRWTITPMLRPSDGSAAPYHMIADLYATSREQMQIILDSPEGRAAREDLDHFVTGGVTFLTGYEETIDLP
jgi:uncharacterized protein (TIGR02118 family)